ncbi:MAG: hypothetical protein DRJ07_20595 [Bacteroidetes bacterium]|nr:MAG: hypothetical protein DRJ07_20595 [Bacteroidota bacterium]
MNLQNELNKILSSILGKVEFKNVSSLLLDQKKPSHKFRNSLRSNIDLIITFAENNVTEKKYLNLLLALGESCSIHGEIDIAKEVFGRIISKKGNNSLNIRGYANLQIAIIESNQANWDTTNRSLRNAAKLFNETNDKTGLAECDNILGTLEAEKGKIKLAKIHFEKAYFNVKHKRKSHLKTKIEVNLGIIYNMLENYGEAEKFFRKSLTTFKNEKEKKRIAEIKHNLGMMYLKNGKYKQAIKEFENSLKISEVENFSPIMGITYLGLGETYLLMGNMRKAVSSTDNGFEKSIKINDRLTIADIYKVKGVIYKKDKNYKAAENYLLTSLRINKEIKNELNIAETNYELGLLHEKMEKPAVAKKYFKLALKYYNEFNCKKEIEKIKKHLDK